MSLVTLYRPTGPGELELVRASGMRRFPPRLKGQPIFYPVLTLEYAEKIARDWNSKDPSIGKGYVLAFDVPAEVIERYPAQLAGGKAHQELWVPAAELGWLNDRIVGEIRLVSEFAAGERLEHDDAQ